MVILFSNRKNKTEKDIIKILTACGADIISDKSVTATGGFFTVNICYKLADLNIKKGIALILDDTEKFINQKLPIGVIGICEDSNKNALKIFEDNTTPVITYGNSQKNTLTISSISENNYVITLQRTIIDIFGKRIYPTDFKLNLKHKYSNQAILCSVAILLLNGTEPTEF